MGNLVLNLVLIILLLWVMVDAVREDWRRCIFPSFMGIVALVTGYTVACLVIVVLFSVIAAYRDFNK